MSWNSFAVCGMAGEPYGWEMKLADVCILLAENAIGTWALPTHTTLAELLTMVYCTAVQCQSLCNKRFFLLSG